MILVDTGPIVAMIDREDDHYEAISSLVMTLNERLVTTDACITEALYLIDRSAGWPGVQLLHAAVLCGEIDVLEIGLAGRAKAFELMERFRDQPCDYADATVLSAAEQTGIRRVLTIDKHFHAYRLSGGEAVEAIPG